MVLTVGNWTKLLVRLRHAAMVSAPPSPQPRGRVRQWSKTKRNSRARQGFEVAVMRPAPPHITGSSRVGPASTETGETARKSRACSRSYRRCP